MLCFVCLIEQRSEPNKMVTYYNGTGVCREHVLAIGNADALSFSYKLKGIGEQLRKAASERANNGPENDAGASQS